MREVIALRDRASAPPRPPAGYLPPSAAAPPVRGPARRRVGRRTRFGARRDRGRRRAVDRAAPPGISADPPMLVAQLLDAVTALDEDRAHAVLDALRRRSIERHHRRAPAAVRAGRRDEELGRIGIAQEHFASSLVRRRLGALSLTWGVGTGPVAVLACPPGEFHDIVLLSFGVLLGRAGWRIRFLGPDTPIHSLAAAARLTQADAVVLACRRPTGFRGHASALRRLSEDHPVWIAGRGATPRVLEEVGVPNLGGDLIAAVAELTATARARRAANPRAGGARVREPSGARGGAEPTA